MLGTLAAFALQRYRFFGRDAVSLLIVLPIALPGIVTGIALNNAFTHGAGRAARLWSPWWSRTPRSASWWCSTTCIARLRRLGGNLEEASMDLGADAFTTFRLVTFPLLRSALLAGGLLAFALSFDEIIVTTFTAGTATRRCRSGSSNLFRPNQAPVVNVVRRCW